MHNLPRLFISILLFVSSLAWAGVTHEFRMSLDDVFRITENDLWHIEIEKELALRFADVKIKSKNGYPFSMMLYFKCDTPDLAKFDTSEKIAKSIRTSSEQYIPYIVEKKIDLQPVPLKSTYGFLTVLTDAEVAKKPTIAPGEYKYMTRGMLRLSKDSVLGFSIMSNDINSPNYKRLLEYVYGFVKSSAKS